MSSAAAGWLQVALLVAALAACYVPVGNYMAHIFTTDKHWRVERGIYKVIDIDPSADQKWSSYLRSMLAFSLVSVLFLYGLERLQHYLLLSLGMANVPPALAWNTAASFVTNTNWQNYSGESTMGYLTQMGGLAVQNFLSAAVGIVVAIALPRTFGKMVKDNRQGYALLAVMVIIWLAAVGGISFFEARGAGVAPQLAHGAMEGKNVAFGTPGSSLFAASTTVTSTGSVNSFHDSFTPFGGGIALFDIALGEIAPGGVGAGLYGILVLAMVTVFVAGLMVGRTPGDVGKKIRPTEMKD